MEGDITLFGIPRVVPGMVIDLNSRLFDKKGNYYIDKVVKSFSKEGFRQVVSLGRKVL
ncbi:M15 family metallopeptidase [Dysgonomonas sp. 511]|uniref:M15 family metallopeptidase n=1 Tax=Dysgonomonas sp. 511 TaxID=2302930 RepID=UPI0013D86BB4|nr:M15 family metallopeptidase [Dysgonomonas sp. 511]